MYYWLLLIPIFAFIGWYFPSLRLFTPLRITILIFLILALINPSFSLKSNHCHLVVLIDRSSSHFDVVEANLAEWKKILTDSAPISNSIVDFFEFTSEIAPINDSNSTTIYPERRNQTRTAEAIQFGLSKISPNENGKLLLLSDGFSTQPTEPIASQLLKQNVALDVRLSPNPSITDARISRFELPTQIQPKQTFPILIECLAPSHFTSIPIEIWRNNVKIGTFPTPVKSGRATLSLSDSLPSSALFEYSAKLLLPDDPIAQNNESKAWVNASSKLRILLVSPFPQDPLKELFAEQNFEILHVTDFSRLDAAMLTHSQALILNNVPANKLPAAFLRAIPFYIQQQGAGLLMTGGRQSFASGGYFDSPIDPLLPVSLISKNDTFKNSIALGIVLDCSGSMSALSNGVPKMHLANSGAILALNHLTKKDSIVVDAVDTETNQIVPLSSADPQNGKDLHNSILGISPGGGGIFCFTGIKNAWEKLLKAPQKTRHIILFADAADAEEDQNCEPLIKSIVEKGGKISIIGLGSESDKDANFLKKIATLGNGNCYFSEIPEEIPALFSQEAASISRAVFSSEPQAAKSSGLWREISPQSINWPNSIPATNICYPKPKARTAFFLDNEEKNPLVSWINEGLGRTAAITFPVAGEASQTILAWKDYPKLLNSTLQWLVGSPIPSGIGIQHNIVGSTLQLDLFYNPDTWNSKFIEAAPQLKIANSNQNSTLDIPWTRLASGHFSAEIDLSKHEAVQGVIQLPGYTIPFGPITSTLPPEWDFAPARLDDLQQTVSISNGKFLSNLADAWKFVPTPQQTHFQPYFIILLIILILADTLLNRLNINLSQEISKFPTPSYIKLITQPWWKGIIPKKTSKTHASEKLKPEEKAEKINPIADENKRKSRFDQAKR